MQHLRWKREGMKGGWGDKGTEEEQKIRGAKARPASLSFQHLGQHIHVDIPPRSG
jgi:hypothetical protein